MVRAGRMGPTWILVGAWLAPLGAVAQASPEQGVLGSLHVDLGRYFFVDDTALSAATRHLNDQLAALDALRTSPPGSGRDLLQALELRDSVQLESDRLWAYYNLRSALDTRDLASARAKDDLETKTSSRTEWVTARLASIDGKAFDGMVGAESRLTRYASEAAAARRAPAEARSATAHRLFSDIGALATDWQFPLWQRLAPDARDARAFVLLETVRSHDRLATLQGYPSFLTQSYEDRGLAVDEVTSLTLEVRANAALFRRFLSARAAREAGPTAASAPPVSVHLARAWMKGGLAPLGREYGAEVDALLDPANGRLEMAGGRNRRAGGFSFISPGKTTGVYLALFSGSLRDVSRLVHESGHAIHRRLMDVHGVPYPYRGGPLLMEPVALFGELLVWEHVAATASDPAVRAQAEGLFLSKAFEVFYGARDAELEQALYQGLHDDAFQSADDLDVLTKRVDEAYTADGGGGAGTRWMHTDLMVEDPLYLSNYLHSGLIALALFERYRADPTGFGARYVRFLSGSFAESSVERLKAELGIDLYDPQLLNRGLALLERQLAAYEAMR